MGTHEEIKEIIRNAKDENDARIKMYQWGINRGYGNSNDLSKERFLTNVLNQTLDDILKNPNILWGRDACKDDRKFKHEIEEEKITGKDSFNLLNFEEWSKRNGFIKENSFYKICAYVSSMIGSDVFNVFLQHAKINDLPKFQIVENPVFITQHCEQFVEENEWRLSDGEKNIFELIKDMCEEYKIKFPDFPIKDIKNELWSPIERDDLDICGWLCINKNTKECYIIKIY